LAFQADALATHLPILSIDECRCSFYLRMTVADKPGVLARVATILSEANISIEAIIQKEAPVGVEHVNLVLLTHDVVEKQLDRALGKIESLPEIQGRVVRLRLETLNDGEE
jgi:homoserine dehydrogenase